MTAGDPDAIAAATRPLAAHLLRNLAKLDLLQGKPQDAAHLYQDALAFQSTNDLRLELASALIYAGQPREAATEAAAVTEADPLNAPAWRLLGAAKRAEGSEDEAVAALSKALTLSPNLDVAYALGCALLASHQRAKADQLFQQIITNSANAAIWHVAVGDAYREGGDLPAAVEEFKKAIAIDPRAGHAEFFLGITLLQLNQWGPSPQIFDHLRAAVRLAPREYLGNFYLGALESTAGADIAGSDRHLHIAAQADPGSPEVWLYLGFNDMRQKNTQQAKLDFRKAIELTGADEQRNNYQIRRVYAVLGRILVVEGNHAEGDVLLAKYKRLEQLARRGSADSIADSANADLAGSLKSGVAEAKASFPGMSSDSAVPVTDGSSQAVTATLGSKPKSEQDRRITEEQDRLADLLASSLNDLGTAEARKGQYQTALDHFRQAEHWHTPSPVLLHNIGAAAFRIGDFQESARALELYFKAAQGASSGSAHDDRSQMMLAMSLFSLGQFAEADKAFSQISASALADPRAAYSWAFSLAHTGQQQHANQIADNLRTQPLPPDVMSLVCHIYMDTENYEASLACFRNAYQANPSMKLAHYQVAESLIRLDRPAEAVPELRQELTLTPDNPDVQYSLAFALLQTSHKEEALAILENVTSSHPTHAQAQYQLGKALLEQGKAADAVKHLELAEQNDPAPDYIHYQLQAAYRKAGRAADADRELQIYRDIKSRNRAVTPPHS